MKFYLLDDDKHIRMILKQIITDRELGTVCGTGSNGHEGLEDVFELKPDIIIVDLLMPEMDGIETARQIRAMARADARTIPIFAITADAFAEDVEAAKQAGMNSHLAKPLDIPHMMGEIQKYLHA